MNITIQLCRASRSQAIIRNAGELTDLSLQRAKGKYKEGGYPIVALDVASHSVPTRIKANDADTKSDIRAELEAIALVIVRDKFPPCDTIDVEWQRELAISD
jgi:hypothetical protein